MQYDPPHGVRDINKLNGMIEHLRNGGSLPPVIVDGEQAITGSHRLAAVDKAHRLWTLMREGWESSPEPRIEAIDIDVTIDWDEFDGDYNALCETLYNATNSDAVRSALEDQRE